MRASIRSTLALTNQGLTCVYVNMASHTFTPINVHSVYTRGVFFRTGDLPTFLDLTFAIKGLFCRAVHMIVLLFFCCPCRRWREGGSWVGRWGRGCLLINKWGFYKSIQFISIVYMFV